MCISYNVIQYLAFLVSQVQAITWGILSLLGILMYTEDIELQLYLNVSDRFQIVLVLMYFFPMGKCMA